MFLRTTAQSKISKLRKRIRIVQGGTSSSKTFSIIPLLISYAIDIPNSEISIVAESVPHLKRGAVKDFISIMVMTGKYKDSSFNKSDLKYKFGNGSFIEFFSVDQPDKLRGARRDVLFINECKAREKTKYSSYWANWWSVYGLGQVGSLEGVIFSNWSQIDTVPEGAKLIGYGMDFGFTNDPTTLVAVYRFNDSLIVDELIYKTGLLNSDIINKLTELGIVNTQKIYGDSAEPKSIEEIYRSGFNIKPVLKGSDSVKFGIQILQDYKLLVTKESTNLIKELRAYTWDTDKTGKQLNSPIDSFNHCIDAMRYLAMMELKKKHTFDFSI